MYQKIHFHNKYDDNINKMYLNDQLISYMLIFIQINKMQHLKEQIEVEQFKEQLEASGKGMQYVIFLRM